MNKTDIEEAIKRYIREKFAELEWSTDFGNIIGIERIELLQLEKEYDGRKDYSFSGCGEFSFAVGEEPDYMTHLVTFNGEAYVGENEDGEPDIDINKKITLNKR